MAAAAVFSNKVIQSKLILRCWMDSCKLYLASAYLPYINKNYLLSLDRHDYSNFNDYSKFNCNRHDYSNFNAENVVTEVQETLDNLPISQNNPCETLDSGILMLEQCLNEQAPIKKLSNAKQKLSHKQWITPCLLKSIKTKNRLYRALVSAVKRPMQSLNIKSTGIKLLIYWKSTKKLLSVAIFVLSK